MSLYRGAGGASDATDDSTVNAVAGYASAAASSASSAATSATEASTSASAAASSASGAASSASSVATNAANAATSASSANTYATQAGSSKDAAAASAVIASTKAGEASSSASTASSASATATTKAGEAVTSADEAAASAVASAASAADALAIYGDTAAVEAAVTAASNSATNATTQATNSATSAVESAASATLAYEYEQNSGEWATVSQGAANSAQGYATAALSARDATLAAYDSFDDRYLGVKDADPTLDNDGNTLLAGSLYFNSSTQSMKLYTGSVWVDAYVSGNGFLVINNNLSDLQSAATARTNLGLGTAATTSSTAYATAAQGTKADTAFGWGNHASAGYAADSTVVKLTGDQTIAGTKTLSSNPVLSAGTANGVTYLNGSKVLTTGTALTFDGSNFVVNPTNTQFYVGSSFAKIENKAGASASFVMADTTDSATIKNVASSIAFMNSGTEGMRLTSTGLGVGTSSPGAKLDVVTGSTNRLRVSETSSNLYFDSLNAAASGWAPQYSRATTFSWLTAASGAPSVALTLDSSGNLGLGVTPSAWGSNYKAFQNPAGSSAAYQTLSVAYTQNAYDSGVGAWKYLNTGAAGLYNQSAGSHVWYTATSGTAGNAITFTQALTLSAAGNLLLGGTTDPGGTKVLYIANGTVPGTPTAGGVLYVESGALKYKGSSGTVTTLGAA